MFASSAASPSAPAHSPEVQALVVRINSALVKSVENSLKAGHDLLKLFGGKGKPGLLKMVKSEFDLLGLRCKYAYARQLMKTARSPNLQDQTLWPQLPLAVTSLYEVAQMTEAEFKEGLTPVAGDKPVIHPQAQRAELYAFRKQARRKQTRPRARPQQLVFLIYLEDDNAETVSTFLDAAITAGLRCGVGDLISQAAGGMKVGVELFQQFDESGKSDDGRRKGESVARYTSGGAQAGARRKALTMQAPVSGPRVKKAGEPYVN